MMVYIIDQIEHGNGGVMGTKILDHLPLDEALKKTPFDYNCHMKMFGFFPFICRGRNAKTPMYLWDDLEQKWVPVPRPRPKKIQPRQITVVDDDTLERIISKALTEILTSAESQGDQKVIDGFKGRSPTEIAHSIVVKIRKGA